MKKYIGILFLLSIVLFALGNIISGDVKASSKHYDNGEISFDYPDTWHEVNDSTNNSRKIVTFSSEDSKSNLTVYRQSLPSNYNLGDHSNDETGDSNFQFISTRNLTLNGVKAYENVYNIKDGDNSLQRKEMRIEKNGIVYNLISTSPTGSFGSSNQEANGLNIFDQIKNLLKSWGLAISEPFKSLGGEDSFDLVANSFKVGDTGNVQKSTKFGEIIMPTIGADWLITTDSVNTPGSVYFLSQGVFPGENGEMGLLGHHTTHHAPFLNINKLGTGDPIIIKDFLTRKEYTYNVVSNGDIRWGVEGVSMDLEHDGKPRLILVTCYPPGFSRGAWIVHSKLESVKPL